MKYYEKPRKNIVAKIIAIVLVLALLVGAGFWLFKGNNVRTLTLDKAIEKGVVSVIPKGKAEDKAVDGTTIKVVSLGDEIVINYDGEIVINEEKELTSDYLLIKGVIETKDGKLLVNDNVSIQLIKAETPTEETK